MSNRTRDHVPLSPSPYVEIPVDYDDEGNALECVVTFDSEGSAAWVDAWDEKGARVYPDGLTREAIVMLARGLM